MKKTHFAVLALLIVISINFTLANDNDNKDGYGFSLELDNDVTTTTTTSNSSLGTTTSDATFCPQYSSCSDCVQQFHCVWCDAESSCSSGTWYGSSTCSSWEWKQCKIAGRYALYGTAGVSGLLIIFSIILIACCCRPKTKQTVSSGSTIYRTKNEREEYENLLAGMEKESPYGSYTSSKDRKWGINTSGYQVGHV